MERIETTPRRDWQKKVEEKGFLFHTPDEKPYWDESVYYRFTAAEIDAIETATYALNEMCLEAVEYVISERAFDPFLIPPAFIPYIAESWRNEEVTIYGRFDLAYDGRSAPKMLEYNADTPTSLLEQAVIQWYWLKECFPKLDQFNSTHDRLIEAFGRLKKEAGRVDRMYFTCLADNVEDFMTTSYLRDTAAQAGFDTEYLALERVGFNAGRKEFVDENERHMALAFKLYPWEWMVRERFADPLLLRTTRWLEAPWKMLLSNKAILPVLYKLFPDSPYLLPASYEPMDGPCVRKPILSREGANVTLMNVPGEKAEETDGPYGPPYVYQKYTSLPDFRGNHPVIGSWMVNGYATGVGIREDGSRVTGNFSRFVPHVFR